MHKIIAVRGSKRHLLRNPHTTPDSEVWRGGIGGAVGSFMATMNYFKMLNYEQTEIVLFKCVKLNFNHFG